MPEQNVPYLEYLLTVWKRIIIVIEYSIIEL